MTVWLFRLFIVVFPLAFLSLNSPFFDPDFGWHLRAGEWITQHRVIPGADIFSHSYAGKPWVDHEWLQDLLISQLHSYAGLAGVQFWYAFLGATVVWLLTGLFVKPAGDSYPMPEQNDLVNALLLKCLAVIVCSGLLLQLSMLRPQIFTLIGFSLVLFLLVRVRANRIEGDNEGEYDERGRGGRFWCWHRLYWLPIVVYVWSWLHAGFVIGLALISGVAIAETANRRIVNNTSIPFYLRKYAIGWGYREGELRLLWRVLLVSAVLTLLQPYGISLYGEVLRTLTDGYGKSHIIEWQPLTIAKGAGQFALVVSLVLGVRWFFQGLTSTSVALFSVLLFMALSSMRHTIFLLPFAFMELGRFPVGIFRENENWTRLVKALIIASQMILLIILLLRATGVLSMESTVARLYPQQALSMIGEELKGKNLLNEYNWGGYLLYYSPQIKTFVDGRMPHWRDGERGVMEDYSAIIDLETDWQKLLQKYGINAVFVETDSAIAQGLRLLPEQWTIRYEDKKAIYFLAQQN
ncbi:MAG: hypothetical protein PHC51_04440 [bacterium]|nr:hypothetical protein [bacterium]